MCSKYGNGEKTDSMNYYEYTGRNKPVSIKFKEIGRAHV